MIKKGSFCEFYDKEADFGNSVLVQNFAKGIRVLMTCCGVSELAFDKNRLGLFDLKQTKTAIGS